MTNPLKLVVLLSFAVPLVTSLSGCALAVGAAAGGTAVYVLKDKGYEVQSPVTKKENSGEKNQEAEVVESPPKTEQPKALPAGPQCPDHWSLDKKSVNQKTGAYACKAKPGTALPKNKLECREGLGYFENPKRGVIGCK